MSTVLYVALGVLVGVVLAPLLLYIAFKLFVGLFLKKLIAAVEAAGAGGGVPPFRLEVEPERDHEWQDDKLIGRLTSELEGQGFRQAGDYTIYAGPVIHARGFVDPERRYYALMYEWPQKMIEGIGIVVDLAAVGAGEEEERFGRQYTVSNIPPTGLEKPPWSTRVQMDIDINNAAIAVGALVDRMNDLVDGVPLLPVTPEQFVPMIKASHAREMDWQIERGGLQRDEILRNAVKMGGLEEDNEEQAEQLVTMTQSQWRHAIAEFVSEETQKRFVRHVTKMSAGEWEDVRDRLYIVHERSMQDDLESELIQAMIHGEDEDDDDAYERAEEAARQKLHTHFLSGEPLRDAFASAQAMLPKGRRYKRLARIKSPWPADVYLEPEEADD